jgi:hypothetical protein
LLIPGQKKKAFRVYPGEILRNKKIPLCGGFIRPPAQRIKLICVWISASIVDILVWSCRKELPVGSITASHAEYFTGRGPIVSIDTFGKFSPAF